MGTWLTSADQGQVDGLAQAVGEQGVVYGRLVDQSGHGDRVWSNGVARIVNRLGMDVYQKCRPEPYPFSQYNTLSLATAVTACG